MLGMEGNGTCLRRQTVCHQPVLFLIVASMQFVKPAPFMTCRINPNQLIAEGSIMDCNINYF